MCNCQLSACVIFLQYLRSVYVLSKIEQNLIYFLVLFFNLTSFHVNLFFYIFPALVIGDFLKTFSGCCLGISKALLCPKQYGSGKRVMERQ